MRTLHRIKKSDLAALLVMLVGTGLSIIGGKIFGWLIVGAGLGGLVVMHLPLSWLGRDAEIAAPPPKPQLPPPKLNPRIKKFGTRTAFVHVPYDASYFAETTNPEKKALLAIFENEVHGTQTVGYINDVSGKIRFKDEKGNEIPDLRVQQGCWLQASSHEVNFPANAQHELIVATKDYYRDARIVREAYRHYAELKNTKFKQEKLYVEVSLISKGETLITGHYILVSTDKDFSLMEVTE